MRRGNRVASCTAGMELEFVRRHRVQAPLQIFLPITGYRGGEAKLRFNLGNWRIHYKCTCLQRRICRTTVLPITYVMPVQHDNNICTVRSSEQANYAYCTYIFIPTHKSCVHCLITSTHPAMTLQRLSMWRYNILCTEWFLWREVFKGFGRPYMQGTREMPNLFRIAYSDCTYFHH